MAAMVRSAAAIAWAGHARVRAAPREARGTDAPPWSIHELLRALPLRLRAVYEHQSPLVRQPSRAVGTVRSRLACPLCAATATPAMLAKTQSVLSRTRPSSSLRDEVSLQPRDSAGALRSAPERSGALQTPLFAPPPSRALLH